MHLSHCLARSTGIYNCVVKTGLALICSVY